MMRILNKVRKMLISFIAGSMPVALNLKIYANPVSGIGVRAQHYESLVSKCHIMCATEDKDQPAVDA